LTQDRDTGRMTPFLRRPNPPLAAPAAVPGVPFKTSQPRPLGGRIRPSPPTGDAAARLLFREPCAARNCLWFPRRAAPPTRSRHLDRLFPPPKPQDLKEGSPPQPQSPMCFQGRGDIAVSIALAEEVAKQTTQFFVPRAPDTGSVRSPACTGIRRRSSPDRTQLPQATARPILTGLASAAAALDAHQPNFKLPPAQHTRPRYDRGLDEYLRAENIRLLSPSLALVGLPPGPRPPKNISELDAPSHLSGLREPRNYFSRRA